MGPVPTPARAAAAATWLGRDPPLTPAEVATYPVAAPVSSGPASTLPTPLEGTCATPEESAVLARSTLRWRELLLPLEQPSTQRFHALQVSSLRSKSLSNRLRKNSPGPTLKQCVPYHSQTDRPAYHSGNLRISVHKRRCQRRHIYWVTDGLITGRVDNVS